jgi:hypothetical protein
MKTRSPGALAGRLRTTRFASLAMTVLDLSSKREGRVQLPYSYHSIAYQIENEDIRRPGRVENI